ncbi:carboxylate-amine ligase [Mycolicibacterium anyangense]|uniref:carboxylate-amine ligase n=1 Tax=Mycolicibacterium anyangense TaxID=1431246 RepID=UPI0013D1573F|nr:glutamate--cysteine ligase [Mycolicibacterium anyangense]
MPPPSATTFGVEEEFLLVDAGTGQPAGKNSAVVAAAAALGLRLTTEFANCQVEIDTSVHTSAAELRDDLTEQRTLAARAAASLGTRLLPVGVPPVGRLPFTLTDSSRFEWITESFGSLTYGQVICGAHVHVGMPDRETALQVGNYVRLWLPSLLALTANSPIYGGFDTGYASWRAVQQTGWPVSGPPPYFRSLEHFDELTAVLHETGAVLDERMLYWDIRPSSHLPTIEVRVSDVPATVEESVTLATVIRALAITALAELDAGRTAPEVGTETLVAAKWKAAHDGVTGQGYDVVAGTLTSAQEALGSLVDWVAPALEDLGELANVRQSVQRILTEGNGAVHQRRKLRSGGGLRDLIADLAVPVALAGSV